jgi:hypothetical protein
MLSATATRRTNGESRGPTRIITSMLRASAGDTIQAPGAEPPSVGQCGERRRWGPRRSNPSIFGRQRAPARERPSASMRKLTLSSSLGPFGMAGDLMAHTQHYPKAVWVRRPDPARPGRGGWLRRLRHEQRADALPRLRGVPGIVPLHSAPSPAVPSHPGIAGDPTGQPPSVALHKPDCARQTITGRRNCLLQSCKLGAAAHHGS